MGRLTTLTEWLSWQESLHGQEIDLGLTRIQSVYLKLFPKGVPFTTITVAGTNGKGSTIAFIESIYQQTHYSVAKFTSPHILNYNERFVINALQATDSQICTAFEQIEQVRGNTSLTYFEFSTLAALLIFAEQEVDIAILEIGLGGRLDSVNVVDTDIAVITNIAIDHVDYLGDTRELIGYEKAGIMRANTPCICGDLNSPLSLHEYAKKIGAELEFISEPYTGALTLKGMHQQYNAALAHLCIKKLNQKFPIKEKLVSQGLKKAQLAGRFQTKNINDKQFIFDVAHNEAAVEALAKELTKNNQPTLAVFSALKDKNISLMIKAISPIIGQWLIAPLTVARATDINDLVDQFSLTETVSAFDNVNLAMDNALKQRSYQRIVVFGSFHVVADALKSFK
ncbi:folylpolyglutamate synthase/dihydrofolate synthase family protein [Candidatus Thioglobus sp.]|uniref:bifunctional folylpolyglutamate synthase/dihydrofolate synthase n=1 Tax=Candidatus Thioglobus sp. TaxID=2026721 RepID=UPI00261E34D3|nr:folylpolyglutamate synthase/dihydrofolate synthase family protein [Candidatus Thioglobus sp.]MDG2395662.1 bifunctional folylpolyglutamate synthase/dihydrofolate synthase [Candidatus Thioglobus sp.]